MRNDIRVFRELTAAHRHKLQVKLVVGDSIEIPAVVTGTAGAGGGGLSLAGAIVTLTLLPDDDEYPVTRTNLPAP